MVFGELGYPNLFLAGQAPLGFNDRSFALRGSRARGLRWWELCCCQCAFIFCEWLRLRGPSCGVDWGRAIRYHPIQPPASKVPVHGASLPYDAALHAQAENDKRYRSLLRETILPTTTEGASTLVSVPALSPCGILVVEQTP